MSERGVEIVSGQRPSGIRASDFARGADTLPVDVFNGHRPRLFAIAYRMLGSVADAEDILQEAFIRWQQSAHGEIDSPEAFLVTIVSRLCLNHLQSAQRKRQEYFGPWLPEPVVTEGAGDPFSISQMDESLSVAFLVLLERLTPMERAVFLLREVFDYEYAEISRMLEQSEANCRQILRRARRRLKDGQPRFDASPRQREELLQRFLQASSRGDIDGLLAVMSSDIALYADGGGKATALPNPIYGAERVIRFLVGARKKLLPANMVTRVTQVNGASGLVSYVEGQPFGVLSIGVADAKISAIYIVSNPEKLARLPRFSLAQTDIN